MRAEAPSRSSFFCPASSLWGFGSRFCSRRSSASGTLAECAAAVHYVGTGGGSKESDERAAQIGGGRASPMHNPPLSAFFLTRQTLHASRISVHPSYLFTLGTLFGLFESQIYSVYSSKHVLRPGVCTADRPRL
ncbi:hypothetical protein VTO73DRAFT_15606 [Trametes versicolor]